MTVNIDEYQRNADWIKTLSWDLPTDKDAFLAAIGGPDRLAHFLTLPAAEAMPADLRAALGLSSAPKRRRFRAYPVVEPPTREPVVGGPHYGQDVGPPTLGAESKPPVPRDLATGPETSPPGTGGPGAQMCCVPGVTADQHRAETSDGRCCTDVPPTVDGKPV